jgi:uncharacterized SAM-binding protein YcdF (DUF218 family)
MPLFLHTLLPRIVSPLGVVVLLLVVSIVFRRRWPGVLGLVVLLGCALPATERAVWAGLESGYPYRPVEAVPTTGAVVVLSGMLDGTPTSDGTLSQWGEATDRFFAGLDLFRAGKAPVMIFTQGRLPWSGRPLEGGMLARRAVSLGVPESQIMLTGEVANTEDEALAVSDLMGLADIRNLTLVTSSFHMPRAVMIFERAGLSVVPYPTDFRTKADLDWTDWVPSARAFGATSLGVREYIGRAYYRVRYQLGG